MAAQRNERYRFPRVTVLAEFVKSTRAGITGPCCFNGFTIVELVVILVLLAIVAVLVAPNLSTTAITLPAVATRVAETIRYTQSLSMSQGQRYRINFTASTLQITDMGGVAITQPMTSSTAAVSLSPVVLSGYSPPLVNGYVAFDTKGVPYVSTTAALVGNATITLTSGGNTTNLVIKPETGSVK